MSKAIWSVICWVALSAGAVEPQAPSPSATPQSLAGAPEGFAWTWTLLLPPRRLEGGNWHSWVASDRMPRQAGRSRRGMPGATVEVVDRFLDDQQERVLELNATWAPLLARSFQMGWQSSCTSQMLGEFMTMTAADLRPPSAPPVWYNGLIPYWVQQGWKAPMGGIQVVSDAQNRPMMLYPKRR